MGLLPGLWIIDAAEEGKAGGQNSHCTVSLLYVIVCSSEDHEGSKYSGVMGDGNIAFLPPSLDNNYLANLFRFLLA